MRSWVWWSSVVVFVILVIVSIVGKFFNGWAFFSLIFYISLYGGGYAFIRMGMKARQEEREQEFTRKQKFEYCWERANQILKKMPGGQGLEWAGGVSRRSGFKTFYDGVQNKPFRSFMAYLENTQQLVLLIFDIDGDDIADFITDPLPEHHQNPFVNFKPFSRTGDSTDRGYDGRYGNKNSRYGQSRSRYPSRRNSGISIQVGGENEGDFDARLKPDKSTVDGAVDKLRGR